MVKKALLIGINYINTSYELNGCINDINNINNFLQTYCEYNSENIHMLTEKEKVLPTKSNIMKHIEWFVSNNVKGDTLFFYYSGHGSNIKDKNKDETDKKDEEIITLDGELSDDWLYKNLVSRIEKDINMWCFFDSCFSGTVLDLQYNYISKCKYKKGKLKNDIKYNPDEWTTKFSFSEENSLNSIGNVCEFSGCLDKQTSADAYVENLNQGAFTFCLLKFLNNHIITLPNNKKRFSGANIKLKDVLKEINALLDINNFEQNSQLSIGKIQDIERYFEI